VGAHDARHTGGEFRGGTRDAKLGGFARARAGAGRKGPGRARGLRVLCHQLLDGEVIVGVEILHLVAVVFAALPREPLFLLQRLEVVFAVVVIRVVVHVLRVLRVLGPLLTLPPAVGRLAEGMRAREGRGGGSTQHTGRRARV